MANPSLPVARLDLGERDHRIRVYGFIDDHEARLRILEGKVNAIFALGLTGVGLIGTVLAILLHV